MTERPKFGDFGTHVIEMVTFGNDGLGCKMAIRKKMVFWAKMCVIWQFCPYKSLRDIWLFWEGIKISPSASAVARRAGDGARRTRLAEGSRVASRLRARRERGARAASRRPRVPRRRPRGL